MSDRCAECGERTTWEQELGSSICTNCGTLSNPSQSILASHLEHQDTSGYDNSAYWSQSQGLATLKGRSGWALAGQDKESRQRRNMISMHEYIRSIASRLSNVGVAPRAQAVFDQAMLKGNYNWGRRAKLIGGAAVAIALREVNRSDALKDIAYLMDEDFLPLSRAFRAIIDLLHLKLTSADPSQHIATLQTYYLQSLIADSSPLPADLQTKLKSVAPQSHAISRTAILLATLLSRFNILQNLPTPPTACAIFILALEAETASSLPHAGVLARNLGARMGDVPWLEAHEKRVGSKGRSKVAKRIVVARGLKDVIQFQEELWSRQMESVPKPVLMLDVDDDGKFDEISEGSGGACDRTAPYFIQDDVTCRRQIARRYTSYQRAVGKASQFLLGPLSKSPTPARSSSRAPFDDNTLTRLLTVDSDALSHAFMVPPTRLQALALSRGGSGEDAIADDELFDEGELEGLMRSEEEAKVLQVALGWEKSENDLSSSASVQEGSSTHRGKRRRSSPDTNGESEQATRPKRSKRIDMDALARILDPETNLSSDVEDSGEGPVVQDSTSSTNDEVLGEWRPLSPTARGFDFDRYDV
ncbi:unnamed protein product [Somion occarium]|uniref:Uncharacterized protein n=1 Tax=Somion occarium TaxID=3059160 RepID=A0ABP1D765_9APHY